MVLLYLQMSGETLKFNIELNVADGTRSWLLGRPTGTINDTGPCAIRAEWPGKRIPLYFSGDLKWNWNSVSNK